VPYSISTSLKSFQISALFDTLAAYSEGIVVVNETAEIVWMSDTYLSILPRLLISKAEDAIGRQVQDIIPNTRLHEVVKSGEPVMMDLMISSAGTFLVSRIPLRDATGHIAGAMGIVWLTDPLGSLRPLMSKFMEINRELIARHDRSKRTRRVQYTLADYLGTSQVVQDMKKKVLRCAQSTSAVLLLGETGVGKELVAKACTTPHHDVTDHSLPSIWQLSRKVCWRLNCSALHLAPIRGLISKGAWARSSWPTKARCSSMRSATCRCPSRLNF
jgi:transcriptional regulator with PAS, ATPase and Fis domain